MTKTQKKGPKKARPWLMLALWHGLLCASCGPAVRTPIALTQEGTDVLLPSGIGFVVPSAYHEVPSRDGRAWRIRGASKPSYETIVMQRREEGGPTALDGAMEAVMSGLEELDHFNLLDVQMTFVGPYLAMSYAADFTHLEVPRRQWGTLIATNAGIVAIFMTSPKDSFNEASCDYVSLTTSLHASLAEGSQGRKEPT